MQQAKRQMPAQAGRVGVARGEAARDPVSDEASSPRHDTKSIGSVLLLAALTRENLQRAFKRVLTAQSYVQSGRRIVVDVDLEKFFDRVNHDILIDRLQKRIGDTGVIRLIRAYLNSGIMSDGVVRERFQGTPQGGPLSPLLANVLLNEVDKELERRGHCFVRYADDCNVYVRSRKAGERIMALLRQCYAKLRLKINETKSAVASITGRKFLGYSFWFASKGEIKRKVAG